MFTAGRWFRKARIGFVAAVLTIVLCVPWENDFSGVLNAIYILGNPFYTNESIMVVSGHASVG